MDIRDLFRSDVTLVPADASLSTAARALPGADPRAVGLVRGDRIIALLTDDDLHVAAAGGADPSEPALRWTTTAQLAAASTGEDPWSVARRMRSLHLHHLPVVERGTIVGVISLDDLSRSSRARHEERRLAS